MQWSPEAEKLKKEVNARIPFFVRGFVDKTVSKASEMIASARSAGSVEKEDVVEAYRANTPKAMQGLMARTLAESGVACPLPDGVRVDEPDFQIGEPMTPEDIQAFLHHAVTGRLGTCAGGEPYIVPLSFVYLDGRIYYHWFTGEGRKIKNIRENSKVCFEADEYSRDHLNYRSVIADGTISRVVEIGEKEEVMRLLAAKFPEYATGASHNAEIQGIVDKGFEALVEAVEIYRIEIASISGKKKGHLQ